MVRRKPSGPSSWGLALFLLILAACAPGPEPPPEIDIQSLLPSRVRSTLFLPHMPTPINSRKCVAHATPTMPPPNQIRRDLGVSCGHTWSAGKPTTWPRWFRHIPWIYTSGESQFNLIKKRLRQDTVIQRSGGRTIREVFCNGCPIFFLNEPENPDPRASIQLTAGECATTYWTLRNLYSQAEIIGPNVLNWHRGGSIAKDFGLAYVRECIELARFHPLNPKPGTTPRLTMSLHMYFPIPERYSAGWQFCNSTPGCINFILTHICNFGAQYGYPCRVYVTEYGACTRQVMRDMTNTFSQDSRVAAFYVFTPRWDDCTRLYDDVGAGMYRLTEVGRGFAEGAQPTIFPVSVP